jgi:hypothetical protein
MIRIRMLMMIKLEKWLFHCLLPSVYGHCPSTNGHFLGLGTMFFRFASTKAIRPWISPLGATERMSMFWISPKKNMI